MEPLLYAADGSPVVKGGVYFLRDESVVQVVDIRKSVTGMVTVKYEGHFTNVGYINRNWAYAIDEKNKAFLEEHPYDILEAVNVGSCSGHGKVRDALAYFDTRAAMLKRG